MRNIMCLLASAWLISFCLASPAFSQGAQTGGITGVIKDPAGAVVTGASVEIFNEQTGNLVRRLTSASDGGFVATLLPPRDLPPGSHGNWLQTVPGCRCAGTHW